MPPLSPFLSISNISKNFGSEEHGVLNEISMDVSEGQIIAILGPSGSGKSTLLHIIGLLDLPTSGEVIFDGHHCSRINEGKRAEIRLRSIGFVYQFHHLLPDFSALENLLIPQLVNKMSRKSAEDEAIHHLKLIGLKDKIHSMPSEMSGGEKQRVAIARAFINKPKIILADEPTGNLDQDNADKILNLFINGARDRGLAAIIVTHNLDLAKKTDKILLLDKGKLKSYTALT